MIQICKLCDQPKKLIKAHIIPKWAIEYIKEENHLFQIAGGTKSQKVQDGYKDPNILCSDCDNKRLGPYDRYAKEFFAQDFQKQIKRGIASSGREVAHIPIAQIDYAKLKIFLLSVLWRASISSLSQFSTIQLGKYEDSIKGMILSKRIADEDLYQIMLATWEPPKVGMGYEKSILYPRKTKRGGLKCYSIIMAGFEVIIKVGQAHTSLPAGVRMHPKGFHAVVTSFEDSTMGKLTEKIKEKNRANRLGLRTN